jgi:hypothetical protein
MPRGGQYIKKILEIKMLGHLIPLFLSAAEEKKPPTPFHFVTQ